MHVEASHYRSPSCLGRLQAPRVSVCATTTRKERRKISYELIAEVSHGRHPHLLHICVVPTIVPTWQIMHLLNPQTRHPKCKTEIRKSRPPKYHHLITSYQLPLTSSSSSQALAPSHSLPPASHQTQAQPQSTPYPPPQHPMSLYKHQPHKP